MLMQERRTDQTAFLRFRKQRVEARPQPEAHLSEKNISMMLGRAERDGTLGQIKDEALRRIRLSTTALRTSDEINTFGRLLSDCVREEWGQQAYVNDVPVDASYTHAIPPVESVIKITAPVPTTHEFVKSLATTGRVAEANQLADHERLHAFQLHSGNPDTPPELLEAQAYRNMPTSLDELSQAALVNHVISSKAYADLDPQKFTSAVQSIDRLAALGFSIEQVVDLISKAGAWDPVQKSWTNISTTLAETMQQQGKDDAAVELNIQAQDQEKHSAQEQAKAITRQVLLEAYGPGIKRRSRRVWRRLRRRTDIYKG